MLQWVVLHLPWKVLRQLPVGPVVRTERLAVQGWAGAMPTWNHVVGDREFSSSKKSSGERGYAKIYYPSALQAASASSVYVKEAEEIPSVDIFMKELTVYRVRGKVQYLFPHRQSAGTPAFPGGSTHDFTSLTAEGPHDGLSL